MTCWRSVCLPAHLAVWLFVAAAEVCNGIDGSIKRHGRTAVEKERTPEKSEGEAAALAACRNA